ncbi:class I SAM-dependent methyltransferase [Roseiflexus sp.]|uniref:class I SAM-dependent methyltransferase n=1 Tax=Roseiflexus sp. TaxID=2562120 RepID=UPI0021DCF96F|nr:class I SAM-dependent methyltransferase [Roseiflexus sp.]GIW02198.1 MAG: SAM-dependent methyltransferase [Roseiflexus sp.]
MSHSTTRHGDDQPTADARFCPVCGSADVHLFMNVSQAPVYCNVLWETREAALRAPKGNITLGYCAECSHIYNYAFDSSKMEYSQEYENSLHFSGRFQQYATELTERLVERYDLYDRDIIEIGCGKGDFLRQICRAGNNRGIGFDKSFVPDPARDALDPNVRFVVDFFGESYAHEPADLIVCRHVLEHIERPRVFIESLRRVIGDHRQPTVYFEVPNALWMLRDLGIWDIIYEHCSYFSPASLTHLFETSGFETLDVREAFGGQFLSIEARPTSHSVLPTAQARLDGERMWHNVAAFGDNYGAKVEYWRARLGHLARQSRRVVVWGAGSKGVTFLNVFRDLNAVEYVVDINPRKQGKYVAGSGQQVVEPAFLRSYQPDAVIVMNALYVDEIGRTLDALGVTAAVESA